MVGLASSLAGVGLFECVFAHFRGGVGVRVSGLGRVGGLSGWGWWGCVGVGVWVVWGLRRGGLLVRGCAGLGFWAGFPRSPFGWLRGWAPWVGVCLRGLVSFVE